MPTSRNLLNSVILLTMVISGGYFFASNSLASEDHHKKEQMDHQSELNLSPGIVTLVNEEMRGIEGGMQRLLPAIAAGDWDEIADVAQKIKASFILKQKLTKKQRKELHRTLPADFIEMDQYFHRTSGKLAQAANKKDSELVSFYYYRLHNQCAKCHAKYATKRFPQLNE